MQDPTLDVSTAELPPHFEVYLISQLDAIRNCEDLEAMKAIASDLVRYNYGLRATVLQMVKDQVLR